MEPIQCRRKHLYDNEKSTFNGSFSYPYSNTKIDQILEDLSVAERITFLEYLAARYVLGSFEDMPLYINIADQTGAV
jgi:hypothetical protein